MPRHYQQVCPTYVGMNRRVYPMIRQTCGMPHVCGDEPEITPPGKTRLTVCPTYVGMNRGPILGSIRQNRMPHVCGDEPLEQFYQAGFLPYAPRMWG